jgi:hypothetical protein
MTLLLPVVDRTPARDRSCLEVGRTLQETPHGGTKGDLERWARVGEGMPGTWIVY